MYENWTVNNFLYCMFRLAELETEVELLRSLVYRAAGKNRSFYSYLISLGWIIVNFHVLFME